MTNQDVPTQRCGQFVSHCKLAVNLQQVVWELKVPYVLYYIGYSPRYQQTIPLKLYTWLTLYPEFTRQLGHLWSQKMPWKHKVSDAAPVVTGTHLYLYILQTASPSYWSQLVICLTCIKGKTLWMYSHRHVNKATLQVDRHVQPGYKPHIIVWDTLAQTRNSLVKASSGVASPKQTSNCSASHRCIQNTVACESTNWTKQVQFLQNHQCGEQD